MRDKCLPLYLPAELYAEIERRGRAQERDPVQEARYIIKSALAADRDAVSTEHQSAGSRAAAVEV